MDDVVGKVRTKIDLEHTDFYVISDHGFRSFRTGVNLNTWLSENGPGGGSEHPFMRLRLPANRKYQLQEILGGSTDFFTTQIFDPVTGANKTEYYVNWSKTKAFALGLNSIFINLKGRETWGCVPKSQYTAVCDEIIQGLEGLIDPSNGRKVIHKVYRGTDLYHGPYANPDSVTFPDLVVGFEEGYRVDWQSTLGGISKEVLTPNRDKWSGDHCGIDPSLTTGILFCNGTLSIPDPKIVDFAATILDTLGVSHPLLQSRNIRKEEVTLSDSTQREGIPII
jgi:predicted AlkP superfamily phosphohydrolase/phosphomutase